MSQTAYCKTSSKVVGWVRAVYSCPQKGCFRHLEMAAICTVGSREYMGGLMASATASKLVSLKNWVHTPGPGQGKVFLKLQVVAIFLTLSLPWGGSFVGHNVVGLVLYKRLPAAPLWFQTFTCIRAHVVKCTCGCQVKPQRFPPEIINDCDTQLNVKLEGLSLVRRFKQRNRICERNQLNYGHCPKLLEKWGEGGGRKSAASTKLILFNYCRNLHEQIQNMPSQISNSSLVELTSFT